MLSQNTLVWAGAAAASTVVVAAGAVAGALLWTHPGLIWPSPAAPQVVANAPELKAPAIPPAAPVVGTPTPPASAATTDDMAASETAASPLKPAFDVVNVEPTGEAVIAGRAAPNAKVELRDAGKRVAEATADASGQFVIIPPALTPGDHSLSLAADVGKAAAETSSVVAVSVAQPDAKAAAAATVAPATTAALAPSPLAPTMRTLATPPAAPAPRIAIQSVEGDAIGGLVAKGSAEPNATVRLYLNGADVADAKTRSDGRWSLTIRHGMTPGGYVMHADEINPGNASVVASADTPFDYPSAPGFAQTPAPSASPATAPAAVTASAGQPYAPPAADVVIEMVQTAQVVPGHTLWALSRNYYGDPTRYPVIYEANKSQIHNPNLIYPGQVFVVPKFEPKP